MHDIAQAAADAAQVPDFGDVLARGQRRRNVRHGLVAGAAALAVATIVGATQVLGGSNGRDLEPAPSPTVTTTEISDGGAAGGPERIIDDPGARIGDAAITADGATAVFWRLLDQQPWALAVTDDGFATRSEWRLAIPGDVTPAGDGFLISDQARAKLWLVDPAGERVRVVIGGPEGPVGEDEVPIGMGTVLVAVDPLTATAHPVPVPGATYDVGTYGGRLSGITTVIDGAGGRVATYHWSDDGGASWQTASFDPGELGSPEVVPTSAGADHVIIMLGDGATIGPLMAVLTMELGADDFTQTDYEGEQASQSGAFVVDGELRLFADLWGDGSGPPRESGLYRWADGALERIPSAHPEITDVQDRSLVDVAATADGPRLLMASGAALFASADGGVTWDELPAR
jgi:hypothetical protein